MRPRRSRARSLRSEPAPASLLRSRAVFYARLEEPLFAYARRVAVTVRTLKTGWGRIGGRYTLLDMTDLSTVVLDVGGLD